MAYLRLILSVLMVTMTICCSIRAAESKPIGVCYGMLGDNLPDPVDVIAMYKQYNIGKLRLYKPDDRVLNALRGSGIEVILGVANDDLVGISSVSEAAEGWINTHVKPYLPDVAITYILAGNEVIPGEYARYAAGAIGNLQDMLYRNGITNIFVSTTVPFNVIGKSFPPSAGAFADKVREDMVAVLGKLELVHAPLMIQAYPYFLYQDNPADISLEYAQFTAPGPVVTDGTLQYQNLLDGMLDSLYTAMEREGYTSTKLIISASGWPTAGNSNFTSPKLALTYNRNFLDKIRSESGTPKKPDYPYQGYVYALFNEDQKPAGIEQNWGIFYPDKNPVYPLF